VKLNTHKPTKIRAVPDFSAMPIRRVEKESMFEYIMETEKYFKSICGHKDLAMLNLCMSELINNVYDHSFSSIGAYVFCQYYPESHEIKMAVSDYGIGIPKSVNI
jgi:anti-sigma regulatory factor (Ser/Thr protein kinase)